MNITLHPSLILWLSVLYYLRPQLVLPFFLAVGFHEMGHVIMLWWLGKPPHTIRLSFFGASILTPPLSYKQEIMAAAAGPGCSLLLALLWPLWPTTALYSLALGLYNLLPLPQSDGDRMLRGILYLKYPPDVAGRYAHILSTGCIPGLVFLSLYATVMAHMGLWPLLFTAILVIKSQTSHCRRDCIGS